MFLDFVIYRGYLHFCLDAAGRCLSAEGLGQHSFISLFLKFALRFPEDGKHLLLSLTLKLFNERVRQR